jgi:hypothetical protein
MNGIQSESGQIDHLGEIDIHAIVPHIFPDCFPMGLPVLEARFQEVNNEAATQQ